MTNLKQLRAEMRAECTDVRLHPAAKFEMGESFILVPKKDILALLKALDSAERALGKVHSAIGDRLLAHGPLSKEYAAIVLADIDAALAAIGGCGNDMPTL